MFSALLGSCTSPVPPIIHSKARSQGRQHLVEVQARTHWNDTGITLQKGHTYLLSAEGTWTDWFMKCDAEGPLLSWQDQLMRPLRTRLRYGPSRDPKADFFTLIGSIGAGPSTVLSAHAFLIGRKTTYTAPATGVLHAFANDDPSAYWNNCGSVELSVSDVANATSVNPTQPTKCEY